MGKIYFQGTFGAYSHLAALSIDPGAEIIPCKTFDECFLKASKDINSKIIIPESNRITGNIGIEYLIFQYRLNIYSEYFQKIEHNLLAAPGAKISDIKNVYSHSQALSQCSNFIKTYNLTEYVSADTAGAAEEVSKSKDPTRAAVASELAAKIYDLKILKSNIEDAKHNTTRFLIMKDRLEEERQADLDYITSFIFRVRNISSALFKALGGFSSNKVNMLKIESYMLNGSFNATQFYADIEGHPEDDNVKLAFEELGFFSKEVKILGSYPASDFRKK